MHKPTRSQNISLTPNVMTPDINLNEPGAGMPEAAATSTMTGASRVFSTPNNQLPKAMVSAAPVSMHLEGARISGRTMLTNVKGDYVPTTVNNYGETNDLKVLENSVSFEARFDSSVQDPDRQCHPGTRKNVLKRLRDWIDNPNSIDRISWLYGPAGAGKSAIAQTIAHAYTRPTIAATFFFFRSDVKRNDGNKLFTTLAYQLAFAIPAIRDHIVRALCERPDLPRAGVKTQFKELLARPFQILNDGVLQQLAPVIIIDGIDECINEDLQRQFLKVICDAIEGDREFPLRFLIVSRPELHIEQAIHRFRTPVLMINLADLDDANRDIENYLVDEFSRIASEQNIDSTWPGKVIIDNIVYKSSGNFIFASLVIRFVGDPYCFAKAQLDIVMNLKMPKTMTPFAVLDQLFLEILRRVPDQDFLKRYLLLLVARISVSSEYGDLHKDDAVLMHVSEQELHANLRRMRSMLKFERGIDFHHKSFVDFLHNSSRSGEYYIPYQDGIRGYVELFVDSFVRYVSLMMEQPSRHGVVHFTPTFRNIVNHYPPTMWLSATDWYKVNWHKVIQPVVDLQDRLLQWQNSSPIWGLLRCNECTTLHLLRDLMHLRIHFGLNYDAPSIGKVEKLGKIKQIFLPITTKVEKLRNNNDLDAILLSLLAYLPETMENWSPNKRMIDHISIVLRFDYAEITTKVCSISDAQKLVDFLDYMIHTKDVLPVDARRKASLLAFKIYERVPIIPRSYFLDRCVLPDNPWTFGKMINSEILSQTIFASRMTDCCHVPLLYRPKWNDMYFMVGSQSFPISQWRQRLSSSSVSIIQVMLSLARAIQSLHSMGIVLDSRLNLDDIFLDSDVYSQILRLCSISRSLLNKESSERFSRKENLFSFGCLFYQMYSGIDPRPDSLVNSGQYVILEYSTQRHIPEYAWQLIQRCCADDPKNRPSMDEVVQEMESWPMEETESQSSLRHVEQPHRNRSFFRGLCSVFLRLGRNKRAPLS